MQFLWYLSEFVRPAIAIQALVGEVRSLEVDHKASDLDHQYSASPPPSRPSDSGLETAPSPHPFIPSSPSSA